MEAILARQPIFDVSGKVVGYELLHRETVEAHDSRGADANAATARTIVSALVDIGFKALVGSARAWINLTERALVEDDWAILDPSTCVIEILESVPVTALTIEAFDRLVRAGFVVALDDYQHRPDLQPFLDRARIVKLDVLDRDIGELEGTVHDLKRRGLVVLAERIETMEIRRACEAVGFDLFQGYFFARPEIVNRRTFSPQMAVLSRALNALGDEDTGVRDLERLFSADPSLTLKLLRIANSAASGSHGVESVRGAIALVGRAALRRWVAILLAATGDRTHGEDAERYRLALERARFVEAVVEHSEPRRAPAAFMTALLSMLDVILGVSLDDILQEVHVTEEVRAALLDRIGPLAGPLLLAEAVEMGLWEMASSQAQEIGVPLTVVSEAVLEAASWARELRATT